MVFYTPSHQDLAEPHFEHASGQAKARPKPLSLRLHEEVRSRWESSCISGQGMRAILDQFRLFFLCTRYPTQMLYAI